MNKIGLKYTKLGK